MAFKRFLNQTAFNRARELKEFFANWQSTPGSVVHLRPDNTVAFYYLGQKALELGRLGATDEYTRAFRQAAKKGVDPAALQEQLKEARRAVINDVKANKKAEQPLARQAALAWELLRRNKEFTLLDEQVQLPHEALADKAHEATRVDLLLLQHASGELALVQLKLADDADLDGEVTEELKAARALPGAMKGGEKLFLQHYQQLFAQKSALDLVAAQPADITGVSGKGLIILGDALSACGRLACLDPAALPDAACALMPTAAPLKAELFQPLRALVEAALAGPRAAYLPRRPRANAFTRQADAEQAAWDAVRPPQNRQGAFDGILEDYSKKNGLSLHVLAKHPRNSLAACAQALAPVYAKNPSAQAGFIQAVNAAAPEWGVKIASIAECHFEAPHALTPGEEPVFPKADMAALTGETGRSVTGLDAVLAVEGLRDGRPVRALIGVEFKYTEAEFACCAGFTAPGFAEEGRKACLTGEGRGDKCYLRHHDKLPAFTRFNLDTMFARPNPLEAPAGACMLAGPVNQLYRSHYAVMRLRERFGFDEALFLVLYDGRNTSLTAPERPSPENRPAAGPLERYAQALSEGCKGTFAALQVQTLVEAYAATITKKTPPWLLKIRGRYRW